MVIFHSYVSLPEGKTFIKPTVIGVTRVNPGTTAWRPTQGAALPTSGRTGRWHTVGRVWGACWGTSPAGLNSDKTAEPWEVSAPLRPTHPDSDGCMTVRQCAKVLTGGVQVILAGMLWGEAKHIFEDWMLVRSGQLICHGVPSIVLKSLWSLTQERFHNSPRPNNHC